MPINKRQHFVPRFYLRNFTHPAKSDMLSIYVLTTRKLIDNAPIGRQGYRDYFYGQDGLDDKLKVVEDRTAPILRDMIEQNRLPRPESKARHDLLTFALFQHARTPSHGDELADNTKAFMQHIAKDFGDSRFADKQPQYDCGDAVKIALEVAMQCRRFVDDLAAKLFVNNSERPFLTSDNPAVFYNQFLETRKPGGIGNTGIQSMGLQIFIPISSKHLLMLFDPTVYRVGGRRRFEDVLPIEDSDVLWMNVLQAANCDNVLYFEPNTKRDQVEECVEIATPFRQFSTVTIDKRTALVNGEPCGEIIRQGTNDLTIGLKLASVAIIPKAAGTPLGNRGVHLRNPHGVHAFQMNTMSFRPACPDELLKAYFGE